MSEIRKKKGCSNFGRYPGLKLSQFAGRNSDGNCDRTYPINTKKRAISALGRAHFARNPAAIRKRVYAKYPKLRK